MLCWVPNFVFLVFSLLLKQPLESSNNNVLPLILCEELVCTFNIKLQDFVLLVLSPVWKVNKQPSIGQ